MERKQGVDVSFWLKRYSIFFYAGIYIFYLGVLFIDTGVPDARIAINTISRVILPIVELGFFYSVGTLLLAIRRRHRNFLVNLIYLAIPLVVVVVYMAQMYSLHISDNFLTVLAFQNSAESRFVRGDSLLTAIAYALIWWGAFATCFFITTKSPRKESPFTTNEIGLSMVAAGLVASLWAMQITLVVVKNHEGMMEADARQTPISAFFFKYYESMHARLSGEAGDGIDRLLSANANTIAFPLEKHDIFLRPLPYATKRGAHGARNMIVIFTEGTSARLINAYGGTYPGLTPAIDSLAAKSMQVFNYYNHTAATYRGLQGQLESSYPQSGGADDPTVADHGTYEEALAHTHYSSVPMILNAAGYQTVFFTPHHDVVPLNSLIRSLGFQTVVTADSVRARLPVADIRLTSGSLSDHTLFKGLEGELTRRLKTPSGKPFFIGAYNIGTHAFLDVAKQNEQYDDGLNSALNRLHNYDAELGDFLDFFFRSPYAENTILVLTSDHANFPEPPYRRVAGSDFEPKFVDRIPLLIYDPFDHLPPRFDAQGRTSIDLAPTMLQLLGVNHSVNSFLGTSLFEATNRTFGFAAIGSSFYVTDSKEAYLEDKTPSQFREQFNEDKKMIQTYYQLEQEDRVFNPAHPTAAYLH